MEKRLKKKKKNEYTNSIFIAVLRALDIYFRSIILITTPAILLKNLETMSLNIPRNYFKKITLSKHFS